MSSDDHRGGCETLWSAERQTSTGSEPGALTNWTAPPILYRLQKESNTAATENRGATALRTYEIVDDPNSMAVFVVTPSGSSTEGENYDATIMISHRKLRTLFKNAVDWYLIAKGFDPNQTRLYRLAQIMPPSATRPNVEWRYMTFHLPDDLDNQAPVTRMLDRMDRNSVKECWAFIRRKLLHLSAIFFIAFVTLFLLLA
ncbi:hypothetical protein BD309DRAFT_1024185 [Dichomitus squalens]|uniref:Uncharacterized protein n=2 Tax=Dichomitus squalens TaxID=114155 RepID=A0A4V2K6P2_9APHY|nr:uncharacterized protein DICSQDRAFT_174885 [Dichomitus squalens LYAD-421 SS1]EJF56434.1 hypothetical protein DICSQDRAFT_174885 [Dichomitus squalens LYAD-421 SS1]TBU21382.1 hypothetical protein BD311DRAFT_812374 [Dichomitus squalens]TBU36621.1 hypothetical protein BD309DRAFT_1024185 [Dichomitus squalens]TBU53043.1 hypothetical protein BD310DRAFT_981411 [Dichomitus squalens]